MLYKVSLIALVFFSFITIPAFAQTIDGEGSESADLTVTPSPSEYVLPYPGMLPDNPLYFIKEIRDSIISFLIADPLKKADFDLLQSDKSLQNGVALLGKKKNDLAFKQFSLEESYFSQAVSESEKAQKQKEDDKDILQKLSQAGEKHKEVLDNTIKNLSGDDKKILLNNEAAIEKLTTKATDLSSQE